MIWALLACTRGPLPDSGDGDCTLALDGQHRSATSSLDGLELWLAGDPEPERAPVIALVLHGGLKADQAPPEQRLILPSGASVVQLHGDLPGDDLGPLDRAHVLQLLRFAAGELPDDTGCSLQSYAPDPAGLILVGLSLGGDLALATLALEDTPSVDGLVLWEVPSTPAFASREYHLPERGDCALTDGSLRCEMDYSALAWDEQPYLDRNGSGAWEDPEPTWAGLDVQGARYVSPEMRRLLEPLLPETHPLASQDDTDAFWTDRRGDHLAPQVLSQHPDLAAILVAGEQDHVQPFSDAPHVIGLGQALSGARWLRLNPDSVYTDQDRENPANTGMELSSPGEVLLGATGIQHVGAAVHELADRIRADDWSADLDAPL